MVLCWSESSRTPSWTSTTLTLRTSASNRYLNKYQLFIHFTIAILNKKSNMVPCWSELSRTPSWTSTTPSSRTSASNRYRKKYQLFNNYAREILNMNCFNMVSCCPSLAEVLKVGIVLVDESVLEISDNHGTILKICEFYIKMN